MKKTILALFAMKRIIFVFILSILTLQANAQFSYSIKAGWNLPKMHHADNKDEHSSFTMGVAVDYSLSNYLGLQSGVNYKRVSECEFPDVAPGLTWPTPYEKVHATFVEIPFLFTATSIPDPQRWRAIWNVGMFVDIPIEQYSPFGNYKTYYGIMAALQVEVFSHYFVRGEYQWALSSDRKGESEENRRTNMLSVTLGYRF